MDPQLDVARNASSHWPRTYCFAHAGGNARTFLRWQEAMAGATTLVAVVPTERTDIEALCDRAAGLIAADCPGQPLLFGHSLGALIAFEVARRLGDRPARLIASGCAAPALQPTPRISAVAKLRGRDFAEAVNLYEGLPPEVMDDPVLQELMLADVSADFRMVADYHYRPAAPLPFTISLVNGVDDQSIELDDLIPWSRECVAEPAVHWSEGGHFYFARHPDVVTAVIRQAAETIHVEVI